MDSYKPRTPEIMKIKELDRDNLVQYSCDEIQLVRQEAQSATKNEISFNLKMPDPSAIVHSTIWLKIKAKFRMVGPVSTLDANAAQWRSYDNRIRGTNKVSDMVMLPGGICPL